MLPCIDTDLCPIVITGEIVDSARCTWQCTKPTAGQRFLENTWGDNFVLDGASPRRKGNRCQQPATKHELYTQMKGTLSLLGVLNPSPAYALKYVRATRCNGFGRGKGLRWAGGDWHSSTGACRVLCRMVVLLFTPTHETRLDDQAYGPTHAVPDCERAAAVPLAAPAGKHAPTSCSC